MIVRIENPYVIGDFFTQKMRKDVNGADKSLREGVDTEVVQ